MSDDFLNLNKIAVSVRMSREWALMMGHVKPTPEERAEMDRERELRELKRIEIRTLQAAAHADIYGQANMPIRVVLDLHKIRNDASDYPECDHCIRDTEMGDHADWPCETVLTIADAYGIEIPS